jgi:glucokinase
VTDSSTKKGLILGLDIGGTKTALVVGDATGHIYERRVFASQAERGFEAMFADIRGHAHTLLHTFPQVTRIGVAVGGPLDAARGIILSPPHLPAWENIPLKKLLEQAFGLEAHVEHDAKAGAVAEWFFGAGRGVQNLIFLTLGTGLGAGFIVDGRLVQGTQGLAGEVGHWRVASDGPLMYGKRGSWEGFVSGIGLAALAHYLYPQTFSFTLTTLELAELAEAGQPEALQVIGQGGHYLGIGLALLTDLLAPEMIVLGNLARRLGQRFTEPALTTWRQESLSSHVGACQVVPSTLGEQIGDIAALSVVIYRERKNNEFKS